MSKKHKLPLGKIIQSLKADGLKSEMLSEMLGIETEGLSEIEVIQKLNEKEESLKSQRKKLREENARLREEIARHKEKTNGETTE